MTADTPSHPRQVRGHAPAALLLGALLSSCSAETVGTAPVGRGPLVDSGSDAGGGPVLGQDAGDDDEGDGDAVPDGCDLSGTYAMEADIDVTWQGTSVLVVPILNMGAGKLRITTRLTIERSGEGYSGRVRACSTETPDFASDTVGERYAVRFPDALWDATDMPEWELPITVGCNDPGCTLKSETLHALLGVDLEDPAGKWPENWRDPKLLYRDHDNDGYPGLTVNALNVAPVYTYPPVVIFPLTVRATSLMLAIRVTTLFDGAITSCDRFDGNGPGSAVETRAASCIQDDGNVCGTTDTPLSTSAATFLDENLPKWEVEKATWTVVRLADGASCDDVRNAAF